MKAAGLSGYSASAVIALSSTACSARMSAIACSRRSRTMAHTSRPTLPTSVYFLATTLINGALRKLPSRRALPVLPYLAGPVMIIVVV